MGDFNGDDGADVGDDEAGDAGDRLLSTGVPPGVVSELVLAGECFLSDNSSDMLPSPLFSVVVVSELVPRGVVVGPSSYDAALRSPDDTLSPFRK